MKHEYTKAEAEELVKKWRETGFEDRGMGRYTLHIPSLTQHEWCIIETLLDERANNVTEQDMELEPLEPEKMQRICLMFPSGIDMTTVENWFTEGKEYINEMLIRYKNFHGNKKYDKPS